MTSRTASSLLTSAIRSATTHISRQVAWPQTAGRLRSAAVHSRALATSPTDFRSSRRSPSTTSGVSTALQLQDRQQRRHAHNIPRPPPQSTPEPTTTESSTSAATHAAIGAPIPPPHPRLPSSASYVLAFTCTHAGCGTRSAHRISRQAYHRGSVLVSCPGCRNRHVIADHLGIFGTREGKDGKGYTIEDLAREKGMLVRRGRLGEDGDIEFWAESDMEMDDGAANNAAAEEQDGSPETIEIVEGQDGSVEKK